MNPEVSEAKAHNLFVGQRSALMVVKSRNREINNGENEAQGHPCDCAWYQMDGESAYSALTL